MKLSEFAELYVRTRSLGSGSIGQIRTAVSDARSVLGDLKLIEFSELRIYRLYDQMASADLAQTRPARTLKWLRTLLNEAWRLRLIDELPRAWPKAREPRRMPDAWTPEQVGRLYHVAVAQPGWIGPHKAGDWWRAFLCVSWDTGLRVSQTMALRGDDIDPDRGFLVVRYRPNTKSAQERVKPLSPPTLEAIRAISEPAREWLFDWPEWPRSRRDFFSTFRYLCVLADIPCPRTRHGELTHKLRRSSTTAAALKGLEQARQHAGHTRAETTLRHYIDPRLLACGAPAVPPIEKLNGSSQRKLF